MQVRTNERAVKESNRVGGYYGQRKLGRAQHERCEGDFECASQPVHGYRLKAIQRPDSRDEIVL